MRAYLSPVVPMMGSNSWRMSTPHNAVNALREAQRILSESEPVGRNAGYRFLLSPLADETNAALRDALTSFLEAR